MSSTIDFYFDFMSPFAYLAQHRLVKTAAEYACSISYKPIELVRIKLAIGNNGPSNRELPVKLKYLVSDLKRWAELYEIPLGFIGNVNTEKLNKGVFFAESKGCVADYVGEAYRMTWGESGAPDDIELLRNLALKFDWNPSEFLSYVNGEDAELRYETTNEEAISKGVFGVPTMMIDDQMWWGNDRISMLEGYLSERRPVSRATA